MTITTLAALIVALAPVKDWHGHDIARPAGVADIIAQVSLEHPEVDATLLAATLDIIGAHESSYSTHPHGLNDHGRSKGYGQTPRASTPDDLLGQVRETAKWIVVSWTGCPSFPLSRYATGVRCIGGGVWVEYQRQVVAEVASMIREP